MTSKKAIDGIKKIMSFSMKRNGFDKILEKVDITSAGNGQCTAEMVVGVEHTNGYGTLHGGFTATVVDVISSMAVLTHPRVIDNIDSVPNSGVSVDLHVSYLAAAKIGDQVVINAETIKLGKTLAFLKVSLIRKNDNVIVAQGTHTKFVG